MRVSAKADYGVRAMVELASAEVTEQHPATGEAIAAAQAIPARFLENILGELRVNGLVRSRRGSDGGYWLARPASRITVADVIRAVEGPLATVHGKGAEELTYNESAKSLRPVWLALRANIRRLLESVTLADLAAHELPDSLAPPARGPDAEPEHDPRFVRDSGR